MENKVEALLQQTIGTFSHQAREYSPLALAYIGDGVYEVFIRTHVLNKGNMQVNKLHRQAKDLVNAKAQAQMYHEILPLLTEEEVEVLKRGRNAKSASSPKNGDIGDYRHATGLEALIGFLYLDGQLERIKELITFGMKALG